MRPDMSKCIVECYREGRGRAVHYHKHRRELDRMGEDVPQRESMQRPYKIWGKYKSPGEQLNPLRRYLLSQVNRPWNKVRSEMSEHMDRNSTIQAHIWQHAVDFVQVNTYLGEDGKVYYDDKDARNYRSSIKGTTQPIWASHAVVYVCPKNGCLKVVPPRPKTAEPKKYNRVVIDKNHQAHCMKGIWYIITLSPIPAKVFRPWAAWQYKYSNPPSSGGEWVTPSYHDVATRDIVDEHYATFHPYHGYRDKSYRWYDPSTYDWMVYGRNGVYASEKKQCNSRELRRLKRENIPAQKVAS